MVRGFPVTLRQARSAVAKLWNAEQRRTLQSGVVSSSLLEPKGKEKCEINTSVAIVGGGPTGLTLSLLLSSFGVDNVVIEKRTEVSQHPQAHFINMRTMEIFRQIGRVEERVLRQSPPLQEWRDFRYCESVLGQTFGKIDHFDEYSERSAALSPTVVAHLSQSRLLPILLDELDASAHYSTFLPGEEAVSIRFHQLGALE